MFFISQSKGVEGEVSVYILALLTIIFFEDITCIGFAVRFFSNKDTSVLNLSVRLCLFIKGLQKGHIFCCFVQLCSSQKLTFLTHWLISNLLVFSPLRNKVNLTVCCRQTQSTIAQFRYGLLQSE